MTLIISPIRLCVSLQLTYCSEPFASPDDQHDLLTASSRPTMVPGPGGGQGSVATRPQRRPGGQDRRGAARGRPFPSFGIGTKATNRSHRIQGCEPPIHAEHGHSRLIAHTNPASSRATAVTASALFLPLPINRLSRPCSRF